MPRTSNEMVQHDQVLRFCLDAHAMTLLQVHGLHGAAAGTSKAATAFIYLEKMNMNHGSLPGVVQARLTRRTDGPQCWVALSCN